MLTVMPSIVRHESRIMPTQLTWVPGQRVFSGQVNGNHVSGRIHISATDINLSLFGVTLTLRVLRPHIWELAQHLKVTTIISDVNLIKAPMPGTLIDLPFQMGDQVTRGQPVAIIEAMKMENILRAPQDGVVQEIFAKKGETLAKEQRILLLGAM